MQMHPSNTEFAEEGFASNLLVKTLTTIPDEIYQEISDFTGLSVFHTKPWHLVLEKTFSWKVSALTLQSKHGDLLGFLPFVSKRRLGGRVVNICLPLSFQVGFAWREGPPIEIESLLGGFENFEVHDFVNSEEFRVEVSSDLTILDLSSVTSAEDLLLSLDYKKVRYMLSRAEREGVEICTELNASSLDRFYSLVLETRHRQGSPVYPKSFFTNLLTAFEGSRVLSLYLATLAGQDVSGALLFNFKDESVLGYAASSSAAAHRSIGAGELVYWRAIADAIANRRTRFNFGSTPHALPSLKFFKEKWGGISSELKYSFYPKGESKQSLKRDGLTAKIATQIIKRMPRPLFTCLTPSLLKAII